MIQPWRLFWDMTAFAAGLLVNGTALLLLFVAVCFLRGGKR